MNKIELIKKSIEDKTGTKVEVVINPVGDISFFTKFGVWKISPEILDLLPISDPLEEQPDKGWIPVSERLPEIGDKVLVWLGNVMLVGKLYHNGWYAFYSDGENSAHYEGQDLVTHWQPLPNPPQAPVKQG